MKVATIVVLRLETTTEQIAPGLLPCKAAKEQQFIPDVTGPYEMENG